MTKEEAFKNLVALNAVCGQKDFFDKEFEEALLVAEKALEQEPCEDAVSRQVVLGMMQMKMGGKELYEAVYDSPSVTPIRPKGEWIEIIDEETAYSKTWHYECSECKKIILVLAIIRIFVPIVEQI